MEAKSISKEQAEELVAIENLMQEKELSQENLIKLKILYSVLLTS